MINKIGEYMNLPFGNYLCQKLFELLNPEQLHAVISIVKLKVISICNNLHGTRSIQRLIDRAINHQELKQEVVDLISGYVTEMATVIIAFLLTRILMGIMSFSNT